MLNNGQRHAIFIFSVIVVFSCYPISIRQETERERENDKILSPIAFMVLDERSLECSYYFFRRYSW